jgi:hypothetical protein
LAISALLPIEGRAGHRVALERELLQLVELGVQQLLDRAEVLARVLVRDLEDRALGHVDQVARERLVPVDLRLDLVGRVEQPAEHRVFLDDPRVLAQVADGGHGAREQLDRRRAADVLQVARLLEVLDERQRVDRLALGVQIEHPLVDAPVTLAVEVVRVEALIDDQRGQRGVRQQDRAEHRLLGLQVLGRGHRRPAEGAAASVRGGGRGHRANESRSPSGSNIRSFR